MSSPPEPGHVGFRPDAQQTNLFRPPVALSFQNASAALIVLEDGRYLMQLRDDKPAIFYPDHWGCFGGGVEGDETTEQALMRELDEELGLRPAGVEYFTRMDFGFSSIGAEAQCGPSSSSGSRAAMFPGFN